jgi:DeoR/GlpR family transcriptional regulator of sugar metabolism
MGVTGVHATAGLTTGDFEEAAVKRALHERAAETVVLASADKLGAASPFTIAPLSELAALVVPASTPAALRKKLQADGVKVSTATA